MSDDSLLRVEHLRKDYPVRSAILRRRVGRIRAVDDVSFSLRPGTTLGVVGESGCGKSTLARLVLRLIEPTAGHVYFEDAEITGAGAAQLAAFRRDAQMVFQDPYSSLDPRATIANSLVEPLRAHRKMSRQEMQREVERLVDLVRVSRTSLRRYPRQLSGGQLQRVALARALALGSKLVVADEPVSSLDVSTRAQVLELLKEIQAELGVAYLFISHDLSVVEHLSHYVAVMYLGRIVEFGDVGAVMGDPRHPYTQALLSAVPYPDPIVQRQRQRIMLTGDPPSPSATIEGCAFRSRCPHAFEKCATVAPPPVTTAAGTTVSCHLELPVTVS